MLIIISTRAGKSIIAMLIIAVAVIAIVVWRASMRPDLTDLTRRAQSAIARKDHAAADRLCDALLQARPNHVPALLMKSELARSAGDYERAITFLERVEDQPASSAAIARYYHALALLELGRAREAEEQLRRSLRLDPSSMTAELKLREIYMLQLRREEFRAFLRERQELRSWGLFDVLDFLVAGRVPTLLLGNWLEKVEKFARTDPNDLHSHLALAGYYSASSRHEDAAEVARRVLKMHADHVPARAALADACINLGELEAARAALEPLDEPIDDPRVMRSLGRIFLTEGDAARAAPLFEATLELLPGDPVALYQLGLAKERLGEREDAARFIDNARRLGSLLDAVQNIAKLAQSPSDSEQVVTELRALGQSMMESRAFEDALACFELLLQRDPTNGQLSELHARARSGLADWQRTARPTVSEPLSSRRSTPNNPATSVDRSDAILEFAEVAESVGLSFSYFTGETGNKYLFETLGGGVAALDYDADGWTDLFFSQGSQFPEIPNERRGDALYRNIRGTGFEDVSTVARIRDRKYSIGCTAGDLDNDGFPDIVSGNYGQSRVHRNNGDGTYSDVTEQSGSFPSKMTSSLALADLDRDGDLDLYMVNYLARHEACPDSQGKMWTCHPSMFAGEQDHLWSNSGDGRLENITSTSGVEIPDGKGLGIVIADLNNDAWPDIYVANDTTPNFLFHNLGGDATEVSQIPAIRFRECGLVAGAALSRDGLAQAGMGIACADLDGNGFLDLYVTNYYLETNALYLNQGELFFVDSPKPSTLVAQTNPLLGFGSQTLDADLDGHHDIFVTNGHVDDFRAKDPNVGWKMPAKLYRGLGALQFDDVSSGAGEFFHRMYLGRGVARLDWNRDSRPDLVVVHQNEPAALLENRTESTAARIELVFIGTQSNRDAVNVRYWIRSRGTSRVFEITGGDGYLAKNELRQVVGIGDAIELESLEVLWPSGRRDTHSKLAVNASIVLYEGREPVGAPLRSAR